MLTGIRPHNKSLDQKIGAFVCSNGTFTESHPMDDNTAAKANVTLNEFCQDVSSVVRTPNS